MLFNAVTPATKDISLAVVCKAGEKLLFTNPAIACLKRFEPKGPSRYVNALVSSEDAAYALLRFSDMVTRVLLTLFLMNPSTLSCKRYYPVHQRCWFEIERGSNDTRTFSAFVIDTRPVGCLFFSYKGPRSLRYPAARSRAAYVRPREESMVSVST